MVSVPLLHGQRGKRQELGRPPVESTPQGTKRWQDTGLSGAICLYPTRPSEPLGRNTGSGPAPQAWGYSEESTLSEPFLL